MILTLENTSKIGKRCRIFDYNKNEIKYVIYCNTETGEVEQHDWDELTQTFRENETMDGIKIITKFYPKPLIVEFID